MRIIRNISSHSRILRSEVTYQNLRFQIIHTSAPLLAVEDVKAPTFPDSITSGDVKLVY